MIKEIVQFVDALPPETFSRNLQLKEGLYMFLDLQEENGEAVLKNIDEDGKLLKEDTLFFNPKDEKNFTYNVFFERWYHSIPISEKKHLNPIKKIFGLSCSPYSISFRRKNVNKKSKEKILSALKEMEKSSQKYIKNEYRRKFEIFYSFLKKNLFSFINQYCELASRKDLFEYHFFLKDISLEEVKSAYEKYQKDKVFNKNEYNFPKLKKEAIPQNEDIGIVDAFSGFQEKKRFLIHRTSSNQFNLRINNEDALKVWRFAFMVSKKQLPNPCPIFVDEDELNGDAVRFHQNGEVLSYSKLIKSLLKKYNKEYLQNFYLIFFQGIKGSRVTDIDFVPQFRYKLKDNVKLTEIFSLGSKFAEHQISNVFQFQELVFNKIFNRQLINETKNGLWVKYFDEIEPNPKYHFTDTICNLMMQYRKAIYDYIYKAKYESISCKMFDHMMRISILEDIRIDEEFQRGYAIKEKLNLWFSLYNYFSQNKNRINMVNKTSELKNRLKTIIEGENEQISTDEEFAFASGQIIWKLLIQSESANRSHALLEPFLQKTEAKQFKLVIARTFETYKHAFTLYPVKYGFDKIMGDVMGYKPIEKNMKNLLPLILAGYFSDSQLKKTEKSNN